MTKDVLRLAAVFTFALATSACSTMSDVGDEVVSTASDVGDALDPTNWFSDSTPPAGGVQPDNAVTTPDLAALPPRPAPTATPESQTQVASSLSADRAQSAYSAEVLRGGSEAAAAPPPPAAPAGSLPVAAPSAPPPAQPLPDIAPPAPVAAAPAPAASAPAPAARPQVAAASTARAAGAQPAVPPASGGRVAVNTMQPSDAALGFKQSTAPALDPSISQWVAPPIVARFQQTSAQAGGASATRVASVQGASTYAALGAQTPTAVVQFPGDGTVLSVQGRAQVKAAAQAFKAQGGQGTIRVVGHASSRTANMSVEQHLKLIFDKSQSRANAVAQELIRQGVPASKVLIEAVGDSQPIYYESMPEGESGNRRAEIFVQG